MKHCKEEDFGAQWALPMEIAAWKKFSSEEVSEKKSKAVENSTWASNHPLAIYLLDQWQFDSQNFNSSFNLLTGSNAWSWPICQDGSKFDASKYNWVRNNIKTKVRLFLSVNGMLIYKVTNFDVGLFLKYLSCLELRASQF